MVYILCRHFLHNFSLVFHCLLVKCFATAQGGRRYMVYYMYAYQYTQNHFTVWYWMLIAQQAQGFELGNFRKFHRGKFPEIYSNLSGNLLRNFFHFICFNYNHTKITNNHVLGMILDKQLSRCLHFHFMHYVQLVLAWLPGISTNSNENYRHYSFQALANIF